MIKRVWVLLVVSLLAVSRGFSQCEIDPFPPYPPSPPEFKKPVTLRSVDAGILASWEVVPDQEGYLVSLCSGQSGYRPISNGVEAESLLIENPGPSGTYYIQVKAFVKVSESYVFNGGTISKIQWSGGTDGSEKSTSDGVLSTKLGAENIATTKRIDISNLDDVAPLFPGFNPSQSFYNADYPGVSNPFVPQATPDGRMAPALITDDGITETVNRVSKKWEGRRNLSGPAAKKAVKGGQSVTEKSGSAEGLIDSSKSRESIPSRSPRNQVTVNEPVVKIQASSGEEGSKLNQEEDGKNQKSSDLLIYIVVGLIVLAFIYFIFQKETK